MLGFPIVTPAKAGVQSHGRWPCLALDPDLRRGDGKEEGCTAPFRHQKLNPADSLIVRGGLPPML